MRNETTAVSEFFPIIYLSFSLHNDEIRGMAHKNISQPEVFKLVLKFPLTSLRKLRLVFFEMFFFSKILNSQL